MNLVNYNVPNPNKSSDLLNELFQDKINGSVQRFSPAVDIFENDQLYGIILSLPGINKEEIIIDIAENRLQVSGRRTVEENMKGVVFHVQKIPKGSFSKVFRLPEDVDRDKIEAKYEEGLLKLMLPKKNKLRQQIKIRVK